MSDNQASIWPTLAYRAVAAGAEVVRGLADEDYGSRGFPSGGGANVGVAQQLSLRAPMPLNSNPVVATGSAHAPLRTYDRGEHGCRCHLSGHA